MELSVIAALAVSGEQARQMMKQKSAYEELQIAARQLGLSAERFHEISRDIEAKAQASLTWGTVDERKDELRRRIIKEFENT